MERFKDYKKDMGITKKRYNRELMSKLQIVASTLLILTCIIQLLFKEDLPLCMEICRFGLLIFAVCLIIVKSYIIKVEINDERSQENATKAGESAFLFMLKIVCGLTIIFIIFNRYFTESISIKNIVTGLICFAFLGVIAREVYLLKYEKSGEQIKC
ncbi:hypothetical protein [Anaerovorax odorimutans]|uniref:hypothetical protein n=1 Tax=Anaerovorax odorimutans TaxID=109327 RepID=UPI00041F6F2B|nr:hypothetical protein [Anaerovorax odorimutans]